jgi:hypothetical protein
MFDDTCYFLPCDSAEEAAALAALCNDPTTLGFIRAASFCDAKRPITKTLLQRVNLLAIIKRTDRRLLLARAREVLKNDLLVESENDLAGAIERMESAFSRRPERTSISRHGKALDCQTNHGSPRQRRNQFS